MAPSPPIRSMMISLPSMNSLPSVSATTFVTDVIAIELDASSQPIATGCETVDTSASESAQTGLPAIVRSVHEDDPTVVMTIPIYRGEQLVSMVCFVGSTLDSAIGVFEVWQPIGEYDELNMTKGYFGHLERFQNVSTFVRFEKGAGLPGQVWRNLSITVHDNLPSHPGFLRAAGASAESLQVAVGIPVFSDNFLATAILISSDATPSAKAFQVWRCSDDKLTLESCGYQKLEQSMCRPVGTEISPTDSLAGLALESGTVEVCCDTNRLGAPAGGSVVQRGFAIPFYEGERITNVLTLLM